MRRQEPTHLYAYLRRCVLLSRMVQQMMIPGIVVADAIANSRYTFSFDTNTPSILNLNVGGVGPSTLTWSGDGGGNVWNIAQALNWNGGAGANTEKFYNLDTVSFDDSASANPSTNLVGTLMLGRGRVTVWMGSGFRLAVGTLIQSAVSFGTHLPKYQ